jgi:uncharacterized protein (TIGR02001 family)|tara:strand:+ start:1526 stop:2185 length:660 start_codon:yes stop_codon:yes gene_type:complete
MNKMRQLLAGGTLMLVAASMQAAEISGNVTLASDYVYRGVSQTTEEATIQGGFDVAADNGAYVGVWGSNVDFDGSVEIDFYLGFSNDIFEGLTYDVGVIHYDYPNQPAGQMDSNFQELYLNLTYSAFTVGLAHSSDFFGETGSATYAYGEYEFSLPNDFSLVLHYGSQGIDEGQGYDEYSMTLSKELAGIDFSLGWHDTDVNSVDIMGSRIVFALSKSL